MPGSHVVILAGGRGTRMKSARPKVLHAVAGLPMIEHVLRTARQLQPASTTIVVGHMAETIRASLAHEADLAFVLQKPQLGTGHAFLQVQPLLARRTGTLVLLSGDVPLLRARTLAAVLEQHRAERAAMTVMTAQLARPYGYGRIVRSHGRIVGVVEERDASPTQRAIREINSGIYAFDLDPLFEAVQAITSENTQREYYLPDLVGIYHRRGLLVETFGTPDPDEIRGINSRTELAEVGGMLRQKKNEELMGAGVTIEDPASTYVDADVSVGRDTVIHPGVHLQGTTRIGEACEIHAGVRIVDSVLGEGVVVLDCCVITDSTIADHATVGPFAHLRPGSTVGVRAKVGNFVELKQAVLGDGSKASHLSYLGDATIGKDVNIGAGTITCNYDGQQKHPTVIEDGAFIGSSAQLVAPVRIGRGAYVGAGSSITEDVPADALGLARARQINKDGWAKRHKRA